MRGNGFVCKWRSETGGTSKPRATAVFCTQNVMTMDMAKETIKLHTKRITAILLPVFRISRGKTECFSGLNQTAASHLITRRFGAIVHSGWEMDWKLRIRARISQAVVQRQRNNP